MTGEDVTANVATVGVIPDRLDLDLEIAPRRGHEPHPEPGRPDHERHADVVAVSEVGEPHA